MDVDLSGLARRLGGSPHLPGFLARPSGRGPWPAVVVLHEVFGLDAVTRGHALRLARAGYLALAPDLFADGGAKRRLIATARSAMAGEGRPFGDIEAARRWLLDDPLCTGSVGAIGFWLGGTLALRCAARGFHAVAVNYGTVPDDVGVVPPWACPVVASFAGRGSATRGAARRLLALLESAGVPHDVKEYPGAGPAFMDPRLPGPRGVHPLLRLLGAAPDPVAAADAWRRTEVFLARYLAGRR